MGQPIYGEWSSRMCAKSKVGTRIVTLAMLHALKAAQWAPRQRAFYRWLVANHAALFPKLSSRTRLFRTFNVYRVFAEEFLAAPSLLGVIDSYGIELLHPRREGRSVQQLGKKGGALRARTSAGLSAANCAS